MLSKILTTADLHLTDPASKVDQYRHDFIAGLPEIILRRKPDAFVILGDITQEKDRHSANLVNLIMRELSDIATVCPLLVMMGNHDYLNEGHPFFAFVNHIPNIEWVDGVTHGTGLKSEKFRSIFHNCLFLPHTRNYERDWADILNPPKGIKGLDSYRFVFAHNTFNGAAVGFGRKLDGIPIELLPKKARIVAGDIHLPQTLGPVTYAGAPYTVNFGDDYKPRLLALGADIKSVSVDAWPQKRLIEVSDPAELPKAREGDIVKVRVEVGTMGDWATIHRKVVDWAAARDVILYRCEPIMTHKVVRKRIKVEASVATSDETLVRQYAKRHGIEDRCLKIGLELL